MLFIMTIHNVHIFGVSPLLLLLFWLFVVAGLLFCGCWFCVCLCVVVLFLFVCLLLLVVVVVGGGGASQEYA